MESEKYIVKYRQKTMIYLGYFALFILWFLIIKDNINNIYPSLAFRIFYTCFCFFGGLGLFYLANNMYNRKVIISQNGVIIKKFLQKPIYLDWNIIYTMHFKCQGYSESEAAGLGTSGPLIYAIIPNIGKIGKWTVLIDTNIKKYRINLFLIPFSSINEINPLIYRYSQMKYLSYENLKNPKRTEVLWTWKLSGSEEEKSETLRFLEEVPDDLL